MCFMATPSSKTILILGAFQLLLRGLNILQGPAEKQLCRTKRKKATNANTDFTGLLVVYFGLALSLSISYHLIFMMHRDVANAAQIHEYVLDFLLAYYARQVAHPDTWYSCTPMEFNRRCQGEAQLHPGGKQKQQLTEIVLGRCVQSGAKDTGIVSAACADVVDLASNVNVVDNLGLSSSLDINKGLEFPIWEKGHEKVCY